MKKPRRKSRYKLLLDESPGCYFCGGVNPATTIDHVPPQACFPRGYMPENFEFPACVACNSGSRRQDEMFGFYSQLLDFDKSKMIRAEDRERLLKLRQSIAHHSPDALPDVATSHAVNRVGSIITPKPVAFSVRTPPHLKDAVAMTGAKLTHALYLRETGKLLSKNHQFLSALYQPQTIGTEALTSYFVSLLPTFAVGTRTNIKKYGDRFQYQSGYKEQEDFFLYAAQFGRGIILWGIVCGPGVELPSSGPLNSALWLSGACGPGANARVTS